MNGDFPLAEKQSMKVIFDNLRLNLIIRDISGLSCLLSMFSLCSGLYSPYCKPCFCPKIKSIKILGISWTLSAKVAWTSIFPTISNRDREVLKKEREVLETCSFRLASLSQRIEHLVNIDVYSSTVTDNSDNLCNGTWNKYISFMTRIFPFSTRFHKHFRLRNWGT